MNRIERRIGKSGARPGVAVCKPGSPQNNIGMLGGSSQLYQTVRERQDSQRRARQANGLAMLQTQGDRISRLEQKLEQLEQMNIMNISRKDAELKNRDKTIDLMNHDFRTTMKELRSHIKELQTKIKHLEGDIPILTAKKVIKQEPKPIQTTPSVPLPPGILEKMEEFKQAQQANITLEINET